jgi:uncharacterized protein (DUF924 family)
MTRPESGNLSGVSEGPELAGKNLPLVAPMEAPVVADPVENARIAVADEIVTFWRGAGPERWFRADGAFDAEIRTRFLVVHEAAARGELAGWQDTLIGTLALVLLLDQFPRNMFRGQSRAFATDARARAVASNAIARGFDRQLPASERGFFYLPFMHSEDPADQVRCVALYKEAGDCEGLGYARHHCDIITRFGRFPHRNRALGRDTTADEQAFLEGGGFLG